MKKSRHFLQFCSLFSLNFRYYWLPSGCKDLLLAHTWKDTDPTGWWMSEKLDGVRAYWDGKNLFSRYGNRFYIPSDITHNMPSFALDGELWLGRNLFSETISVVKKEIQTEETKKEWEKIKYCVFDAPLANGDFEERLIFLKHSIPESLTFINRMSHHECKGFEHLYQFNDNVIKNGGEGVMLRKPHSLYHWKRSKTLLKFKSLNDDEAKIIDYKPGNGKYTNQIGALIVQHPSGYIFKIGSGLNDNLRKNPPPIGSIITFRFQGIGSKGGYRFPVYYRIRSDITWDEVIKNYLEKKLSLFDG